MSDLFDFEIPSEPPPLKLKKKLWTPKPKPPQSLEPLTQAEWDALSPKAKWDSIVALRGPDLIGSDGVKWFTTSVIRYRLSQIMRVGGLINTNLGFVLYPLGGYSSRKTAPFDIGHFLNHVLEAAAWLGIPIVYCKPETFEKLVTGGDYVSRMAIYKELLTLPDLPEPAKATLEYFTGGTSSCE